MQGKTLGVIAIVAVMAVASVGIAFAYTSITNSYDNSAEADSYTIATDSRGDTQITIPAVRYLKAGTGVYLPEFEGQTIEGNLDVKSPSGTSKMRMWVTMKDPMSWTVIQRITLTVDYGTESEEVRTCFDWNDTIPQTGAATSEIDLTEGQHTFRIAVTYRGSVTIDPNSYSQTLLSSVVFNQGDDSDPLSAPSP